MSQPVAEHRSAPAPTPSGSATVGGPEGRPRARRADRLRLSFHGHRRRAVLVGVVAALILLPPLVAMALARSEAKRIAGAWTKGSASGRWVAFRRARSFTEI